MLEQIVSDTIQELCRYDQERSCIVGAEFLMFALKAKGICAHPLTVHVDIWNPAMTNRIERAGAIPTDEAVVEQWDADGCKWLKIGGTALEPRPNVWPGHLVVIVPHFFGANPVMCDLTLPQVNMQEFGVMLAPVVADVTTSFIAGLRPFKTKLNGCSVSYRALPEDRSFEPMLAAIAQMRQDAFGPSSNTESQVN